MPTAALPVFQFTSRLIPDYRQEAGFDSNVDFSDTETRVHFRSSP